MSQLKEGSLFSGYNGLGMAVSAAFGSELAWVADIDKGACKILAHRYPDVPNLGDITVTDWSSVEPVDIITGGSPCQDLSHAGRRAGMTEGTRSNLWVAMREAIAQLRPTYVIWENVRGAYSAAADSAVESCPGCVGDGSGVHLRALGRVLGDLSDLGYDCQWRGLRAADVGAPHGRFRVFVVARLADAAGNGRHEGRAESTRLVGRPDAAERGGSDGRLTLLPSPRTSDTNGAGQHGDGGLDLRTAVALLPTPTAQTFGTQHGSDPHRQTVYSLDAMAAKGMLCERSHASTAAKSSMATKPASASHTQTPNLAGRSFTRPASDYGQYAAAIARWESTIGLPPPAPTEATGRGGAHRLSPRFTEWMMGLPAGWITDVPGVTRNEALKACGNGVVPQQAFAAIADSLAAWAEAAA